ncbi:MAG: helix-turn-helix transcriptional regulator [Chlamydiia bacterium]|nr:helix-turn-helix transcriptional regulator [Chlamydiia bacterium]
MSTKKTIQMLEKILGKPLTLADLLLAIRQGEEMTQSDFAKILGISKQYLSDVERERRFISPKIAASFAKKLGYSEEQFLQLCLQDLLTRNDFPYRVSLKAA